MRLRIKHYAVQTYARPDMFIVTSFHLDIDPAGNLGCTRSLPGYLLRVFAFTNSKPNASMQTDAKSLSGIRNLFIFSKVRIAG